MYNKNFLYPDKKLLLQIDNFINNHNIILQLDIV